MSICMFLIRAELKVWRWQSSRRLKSACLAFFFLCAFQACPDFAGPMVLLLILYVRAYSFQVGGG